MLSVDNVDNVERKPNIGQNILSLVCVNDHQLRSILIIVKDIKNFYKIWFVEI